MADSVLSYLSEEGDALDRIVWKHYGRSSGGVLEQVLAANRGLAALGVTLPAATLILLPVIAETEKTEGVRLWS